MADFEKLHHNQLSHLAFETLDEYRTLNNRLPAPWCHADCQSFLGLAKKLRGSERYEKSGIKPAEEWFADEKMPEVRFLCLFALTAAGVFNPLCSFQGGLVAQEAVKAITQKFSPVK
jgi:ubiquitin-activating enzyme E1